jgi:tetratricopeptide (TPR) repeat protein
MAEDKTTGTVRAYNNGGAKMRNKIRLMGCVIMGMFLLLQADSFAQQPTSNEEKVRYQTRPEIKGYTYNLKRLLEKIEENIKKVDEEIEKVEIRRRNEEREAKVREHFERGNTLYREGKLKEAKGEWLRALEITKDPEMKEYIRKAEKRAKEEELARKKEEKERQRRLAAERKEKERRLNKQAESKYKEALSLYRDKDYQKAQELFKELDEFYPNYKNTRDYIQRIPEKIQEKERKQLEQKAKTLYEQAYSLYKDKQFNQALEKFKEVKAILSDYKKTEYYLKRIPHDIQKEKEHQELERKKRLEAQKREKARLEKERLREAELARNEKINSLYKEATSLYSQGKLDEVKILFNQVLSLNPNHKKAKNYLENKIPNRIKKLQEAERKRVELEEKQAIKKEIDFHYNKAISYYRDKSYDLAIQEFNKVLELSPQHKSAQDYLDKKIPAKIEAAERKRQRELKKQLEAEKRRQEKLKREREAKEELERKEQQRRLREKIQSFNKEGKNLYRNKNYDEAIAKFREVLKFDPENKTALTYLKLIPKRIEEEKERLEREKQRRLKVEQRKKERLERKKQRELKRQKREKERKQKEEIRKKKKEQERLEKEKMEKSKKAIQDAKETAKDTEEETKLRLEDLTYKTEKECLDILGKYPDDKEAFDNLVNLYLLKDKLLNNAKELYKNKDYEGAIQEYNKVLLIEPENKKAKTGIKRARPHMR